MRRTRWALLLAMAGMTAALAVDCAAQQKIQVANQRIRPETAVSSLTVSVSPASVSFQLVSQGVAAGSGSVAVTTAWGGGTCMTTCTINLYGYFADASAALTGGSPAVNVPSSEVLGQVTTGSPTSYTAFTQSGPFGGAGASLLLFTQVFTSVAGAGSRTDALSLEINLAAQPQLPAGSYSGTLFLQAESL